VIWSIPYPGKLGVVEEGALADLLLVDGNPIENIKLIEDPAKNLLVIIGARIALMKRKNG
jgi:imidazolonepropionase-like amidohydrolase